MYKESNFNFFSSKVVQIDLDTSKNTYKERNLNTI